MKEINFETQLRDLLHKYLKDDEAGIQDVLLAKYLNSCLDNFTNILKEHYNYLENICKFEVHPVYKQIDELFDKDNTGINPNIWKTKTESEECPKWYEDRDRW